MKFRKATLRYEAWLGRYLKLLEGDLAAKHDAMRSGKFPFLRATYYRWAQTFPAICGKLSEAVRVVGVGDLHVENFGTWRDVEGRLVWGINDFDESSPIPYTNDLVRLAASANMAIDENDMRLDPRQAAEAILEGYVESLKTGGREFVLAEGHPALYQIAAHRLKEPEAFWQKLDKLPPLTKGVPSSAVRVMTSMFPAAKIPYVIKHRKAGLGSLGRERYVAVGEYHGGKIAREAKAMAPSATAWASDGRSSSKIFYQRALHGAVRCHDPFVRLRGRWIVRRLAPDCSRIELGSLPEQRDEIRLLRAMGFETANVHLGSAKPKTILKDLKRRKDSWLHRAAHEMVSQVTEDWEDWRKKE
jgi:hypothetical protein